MMDGAAAARIGFHVVHNNCLSCTFREGYAFPSSNDSESDANISSRRSETHSEVWEEEERREGTSGREVHFVSEAEREREREREREKSQTRSQRPPSTFAKRKTTDRQSRRASLCTTTTAECERTLARRSLDCLAWTEPGGRVAAPSPARSPGRLANFIAALSHVDRVCILPACLTDWEGRGGEAGSLLPIHGIAGFRAPALG